MVRPPSLLRWGFEPHTKPCYNFTTMDDSISAPAVEHHLGTRIIGRRVICYARVGSTSDIAKQLADEGEPEGTVVLTDEQTAGRGRLGRSWIAPAHSSILMSLILRPVLPLPQLARVTMAVGLGAAAALESETRLSVKLKWPNDILVNGKKCAGILAEAEMTGEKLRHVVVGVGVNVNFAADDLIGISSPALAAVTTLADALGRPVPRVPLVRALLRGIDAYYARLRAGEDLHAEWAERLATLHRHVIAQTPWGEETGLAQAVDPDGALLLTRADGSQVRLIAGDVTLSGKRET